MVKTACNDAVFQHHFKKVHKSLLTLHTESSKSLEGDLGKDRCHYAAFQRHFKKAHHKLFCPK